MRYGMALFIASEVMFFAAFFWAFFASSLFPVGGVWPPKGIHPFNPFEFPFLNTLILLLSGTTVTWAHHSLLEGDRNGLLRGLALTVFLGLCFTSVQAYEYSHAPFHFTGGIYPVDLLHGDRLSRLPRHHRHDLPDRLPLPGMARDISRLIIISASRRPPGIGISSTWFGCSSSSAFIGGAEGRGGAGVRPADRRWGAIEPIISRRLSTRAALACRCPRCGKGRLFSGL